MINIISKELCVGCNACAQRCPQSCIVMEEDHEGFLYPKIDLAVCVDCGICEKVCPVIHQAESSKEEPATYACYNKDEEIRKQSSSGGMFTLLAETVLAKNGVVFGARFDENFDVIHDYTETVEGLKAFRGSKYVQSRVGETYMQTERFLKEGREVLFSGTPCQIAGLKRFLRKEYSNLLSVDFICHGVPSPKVWRMYKESLLDKVEKNSVSATSKPEFTDIQFRDKTDGWKKFSFAATIRIADQNTVLLLEQFRQNLYMKGFLADLYLRPSCHSCPSKSFKSCSDFTIADFWGIERFVQIADEYNGVSQVILHTLKSQILFEEIPKNTIFSIKVLNSSIQKVCFTSCKVNKKREKFMDTLKKIDCKSLEYIEEMSKLSKYLIYKSRLKCIIKRLISKK